MEDEHIIIGKTDFRGVEKPFYIPAADILRHLYLIGQTGVGKSTLLVNMALSAAAADPPRGFCVLDPHGQLADDILDRLPSHITNRVIYFNPLDDWPISLNVLQATDPKRHELVASRVVSLFKSIWGEELIGPRSEDILRAAVFALVGIPDATLLWIPRLLVDDDFRNTVVIPHIKNPIIRKFWLTEFDAYDDTFRQNAIAPLLNKIRGFTAFSAVRHVVAQSYRKVSLTEVMDRGQILICNLSKGLIGEDNTSILMSLIAEELYLSALARAEIPEADRRPFTIFADEIQSIGGSVLTSMLSEARKYKLALVLSHQYREQLLPEVIDAIYGNVGSIVAFRLGASDSIHMSQEFSRHIDPQDFERLPVHHAYIRLSVNGMTSSPFSMVTFPPPEKPQRSSRDSIIKHSRERYGRERGFVEEKIVEWIDHQVPDTVPTVKRKKRKRFNR